MLVSGFPLHRAPRPLSAFRRFCVSALGRVAHRARIQSESARARCALDATGGKAAPEREAFPASQGPALDATARRSRSRTQKRSRRVKGRPRTKTRTIRTASAVDRSLSLSKGAARPRRDSAHWEKQWLRPKRPKSRHELSGSLSSSIVFYRQKKWSSAPNPRSDDREPMTENRPPRPPSHQLPSNPIKKPFMRSRPTNPTPPAPFRPFDFSRFRRFDPHSHHSNFLASPGFQAPCGHRPPPARNPQSEIRNRNAFLRSDGLLRVVARFSAFSAFIQNRPRPGPLPLLSVPARSFGFSKSWPFRVSPSPVRRPAWRCQVPPAGDCRSISLNAAKKISAAPSPLIYSAKKSATLPPPGPNSRSRRYASARFPTPPTPPRRLRRHH